MNIRLAAFGACVAVAAGWAVADDKAVSEKVMKALQGAWAFESHILGGESAPADVLKSAVITFEGDKFTVKIGDKVAQAGTHKVDASKKPCTVDATVAEGEGKGTTMLGILELDGDTMKVCFDIEGKKRPERFESPDKSRHAVMVMKRVKK